MQLPTPALPSFVASQLFVTVLSLLCLYTMQFLWWTICNMYQPSYIHCIYIWHKIISKLILVLLIIVALQTCEQCFLFLGCRCMHVFGMH